MDGPPDQDCWCNRVCNTSSIPAVTNPFPTPWLWGSMSFSNFELTDNSLRCARATRDRIVEQAHCINVLDGDNRDRASLISEQMNLRPRSRFTETIRLMLRRR